MELEDIELSEALLAKRHKELLIAINRLTDAISQNKNNDIVSAIERNKISVNDFVSSIKSLRPPEVNLNQNEVVVALNKLSTDLKQSIDSQTTILEELRKPKEWEFKVNKNNYGYIESVSAKTK